MEHVAFVRNVNQGQRGHPSTADLLEAFAAAGATATAFRSNGTLVFEAADPTDVAAAVEARLDRIVLSRPLAFVAEIVDRHGVGGEVHRRELTLFAEPEVDAGLAAIEAARRHCAVIDSGPGWALVENGRDRQSNGTPTLEAVLGRPATSRGLPTLVALIDRHAR